MDKKNENCIPSYLKFSPSYNYIHTDKVKLPTRLNKHDSEPRLQVSDDGLIIRCKSDGYGDAGAIRANRYVPPELGLFYYEIVIIDRGVHGRIGLGFCEPDIPLNSMPGWNCKSYGYHGDDGKSYYTGEKYGPVFTTGDTIGVGINFLNNTIFFTKNGLHLGTAFTRVKSNNLYPMIGMGSSRESIQINFGQKKFMFDIYEYAKVGF
ncbi:15258_t:CDS:2 [Funneliformis mosseae]|uniref:15258_t:CDS:1 n=1 Tax=Funneliformis mosseae TaxID=27381 RepID=A0A9N9D0F3_FUNMO|nr:15258_t:CDS:2 [Funneliformis mosseae]